MSTRERAYRLINTLDDEKLEALLLLFEDKKTDEFKSNDDIDELMGVFSDVNKHWDKGEAWIVIHHDELMADWKLAKNGEPIFKIEPLR